MMWTSDVKMALQSLSSNKMRSLLTMIGIVIGVIAVVVTVSLGEGVKQQVIGQSQQFGHDLIVVRPGKIVRRDAAGHITGYNFLSGLGGTSLNEQDADVIRKTKDVSLSVPLSLISGNLELNDGSGSYDDASIIATTDQLPKVLNQKVEFGDFFSPSESSRSIAIVGKRVAERLFKENVPVGKLFKIRGHEFIVSGVFEEFPGTSLTTTVDFNNSVFIPYSVGKNLSGGNAQIYEVLAKPLPNAPLDKTITAITNNLRVARGGQEDFTVLKQSENLFIAGSIVNVITGFVGGIAAISLIVGGIGIMNIMLVSVTERTREIGIRKSVGATNRQIVGQFLTEAIVLSVVGGLLGVLLAVIANFLIRIFTNLQPVITVPVMVIAVIVTMVVGVLFGLTPAVKAARKDPITALRYE